jgi:hypothetical protein
VHLWKAYYIPYHFPLAPTGMQLKGKHELKPNFIIRRLLPNVTPLRHLSVPLPAAKQSALRHDVQQPLCERPGTSLSGVGTSQVGAEGFGAADTHEEGNAELAKKGSPVAAKLPGPSVHEPEERPDKARLPAGASQVTTATIAARSRQR